MANKLPTLGRRTVSAANLASGWCVVRAHDLAYNLLCVES